MKYTSIFIALLANLLAFEAEAQEDFDIPFLHKAFFESGYDQVDFKSYKYDSAGHVQKKMDSHLVYTPYLSYRRNHKEDIHYIDTADISTLANPFYYSDLSDTVVNVPRGKYAVNSIHHILYCIDTFCQPDAGCSYDSTHYYYGFSGLIDSIYRYDIAHHMVPQSDVAGFSKTVYHYDSLGRVIELWSYEGRKSKYNYLQSIRLVFTYDYLSLPSDCVHERLQSDGSWHPYYRNVLTYSVSKLRKKRYFHING